MKKNTRPVPSVAAVAACLAMLPLSGCLYANVKLPLDSNLENTDLGDKVGQSDAHSVLGLVAWGDAGTQAAAAEGNIETIKHADQQHLSVLGIVYARYRTIVYGD